MFRRTVRTLQSRIVPVSGRCLRHTYIYMLSLTKARRLSVFSDGALKDSASCGWMRHHGARGRIVAGRCPETSFGRRLADGCGRSAPGRLPRRRAGRCAVVEALYERIAFRTGLFEAWRRHVSRALWGLLCGIRRAVWGLFPGCGSPAAEVCPLEACSADGGFRRLLFVVMGLRIFLLPRHEVCECRENLSPSARRPKRTIVPANF